MTSGRKTLMRAILAGVILGAGTTAGIAWAWETPTAATAQRTGTATPNATSLREFVRPDRPAGVPVRPKRPRAGQS